MNPADAIARRLEKLDLGDRGILVAVSGGPDSVALLRALHARSNRGPIHVAHFNHQLRGEESDADEAFVRSLCERLGVPFWVERRDVRREAIAAEDNLEATARKLRYGWLGEQAAALSLQLVATGHTADDQAETVLHRLLRGSGVAGLRGIAPRRALRPGVELVRPFLTIGKAELLKWLESLGQEYRRDSSNRETSFTRNRIRLKLLPLLEAEYNPALARILAQLAEQCRAVAEEEEHQASDLLTACELPRAGSQVVLRRDKLIGASRHRLRALFHLIWEREGWPRGGMNFARWDRLADVAENQLQAVDLPCGIRCRGLEATLVLGPSRVGES